MVARYKYQIVYKVTSQIVTTLIILNLTILSTADEENRLNEWNEDAKLSGMELLDLLQSKNDKTNIFVSNLNNQEQIDTIRNKLKYLVLDNLKNSIDNLEKQGSEGYPEELLEKVYNVDEKLFTEIYKKFLKEILTESKHQILNNLMKYTKHSENLEKNILGFVTIFNEIKENNLLLSMPIFNLAHHIFDIKNMEKYVKVSDIRKQQIESILIDLPQCLRYINAAKVCVKNVGRGDEFLYAAQGAHNYFLYDKNRRHVFTWGKGGWTGDCGWKLQHINDNKYTFFNVNHREYMYSAYFGRDSKRRYIFTWVPGGRVSEKNNQQDVWLLELEKDFCYIKNVLFDEYMYASNYKYDVFFNKNRRRVFTWEVKGKQEVDKNYCWTLTDCSSCSYC